MTLSPNYPAVFLGTLGDAYRQAGRTDEAIAAFEAYHARSPGFGLTDVVIAYQEKGQPEEAKRTAARLMAARPEFTIAGWRKTQFMRRDAARVEADAAGPSRRRTSIGLSAPSEIALVAIELKPSGSDPRRRS